MPPRKRLDKGKAPMVEEEPVRRLTRSRVTGVVIREAQPEASRSEQVPGTTQNEQEEVMVEPEIEPPRSGRPEMAAPSVQPTVIAPEMGAMMTMMAGMVQTLQDILQSQARRIPEPQTAAEPSHRPVRVDPTPGVVPRSLDMKAFHHMKPPVFKGQRDYQIVDGWIAGIEKAFKYMQCPEEHKVLYAVYQLEDEAERWWQGETLVLPDGGTRITWSEFKERLARRYVPASEKARRVSEFLNLFQGKRTVEEYEAQFRSLARFVPWAQLNLPDTAQKFQSGLRLDIREKLVPFMLTRYEEVFERACLIERDDEERTRIRERRHGRDSEQGREKKARTDATKSVAPNKFCRYCREAGHWIADCPKFLARSGGRPPRTITAHEREDSQELDQPRSQGPTTCYFCGEMGHIKRFCPKRERTESVMSRAPQQLERGGDYQRSRGRGPTPVQQRQAEYQRPVTAIVQATNVQEAQANENVDTDNLDV